MHVFCITIVASVPADGLTRIGVKDVLQWRHNERDGVWNHQAHDCLISRLFTRRSKKTSELRVTVTGEFQAQITSNAGNVSIWCC